MIKLFIILISLSYFSEISLSAADLDFLSNSTTNQAATNDDLTLQKLFQVFTNNPNAPEAPDALFEYAKRQIDFAQMQSYLNKLISTYPNYAKLDQVYDSLGAVYFSHQSYNESYEAYKSLNTRFPASPLAAKAQYMMGKALVMMNQYQQAIENFKSLYLSKRDSYFSPLSLVEIGHCFHYLKQPDNAKVIYKEAIKNFPNSEAQLSALYELGKIYMDENRYDYAYQIFNFIAQHYPLSFELDFAVQRIQSQWEKFRAFVKSEDKIATYLAQQKNPQTANGDFIAQLLNPNNQDPQNVNTNTSNPSTTSNPLVTNNQGQYHVQVGVFINLANAEKLRNELLAKNYQAQVVEKTENGKQIYKVIIGFFPSTDAANMISSQLASAGYKNYVITNK